MRNCIYFLIISLLTLGGCNQSLESDRNNIALEKEVSVILGSSSSRIDRFKGSYWDVVNGGSVKLSYAFEGGAAQTVNMTYDGLNWRADLQLGLGTYEFRASAFNSSGVMIFDAAATKTHTITSETTNLALGIQLNPVMEEVGGTPMPVITQITKPAGYLPNDELNMEFTVRAGSNDQLRFEINVRDNASNFIAAHQLYSTQLNNVTNSGASTVYNGTIGVQIPSWVSEKVHVEFSVYSETLQTTTTAQFMVAGVVDLVGSGALIFMPQAEFSVGVREDTAADTIVYVMDLSGNEGFTDNITFLYNDSSVTAAFVLNPDPIDPARPHRRSGELYRELMEAGTLTITFTSNESSAENNDVFMVSYNFEVPSGATQFNTVGYVESGYKAPEIVNISLASNTVALGEKLMVNAEADNASAKSWIQVTARVSAENDYYNDHQSANYVYGYFPINPLDGTSVTELMFKSWQAPGEWFIESFEIHDGLGSYSRYWYRPDISMTHYFRESNEYNRNNNTWDWSQEESTLPVLIFTVTGEYNPDLASPDITSISLASETITLGETVAVNIEAGDDVSGICRTYLRAETSSDNYSNAPHQSRNIYREIWIDSPDNSTIGYLYNYPYYPYPYPYYPYPYYPYYDPCGGVSSENESITITPKLTVESWHVPGEWIIKNFSISDRAGRNSDYYYEPGTSETYYVRNYNRYDNTTGNWNWINNEETTLPILKFTATGEYTPDQIAPEITNISLAANTVAIGDNLEVYIETSDDVSGVGHVWLESHNLDYISNSNNYNYAEDHRDMPNDVNITLVPKLRFDDLYYWNWNYSYSTGEWVIRYLNINDRSGRNSNYSYRPDISETHYVRSYNQYDSLTGNEYWVNDEETTLPILRFTLTRNSSTMDSDNLTGTN